MDVPCPSASQVKKAGRVLRHLVTRPDEQQDLIQSGKAIAAFRILTDWRAAHSAPLASANMGLRSMVTTEGCRVEVSQRLKRVPTILSKLAREPTLSLERMQDIGGVRAVLDTIDEVRRVESRIRKNRPPLRVDDYITSPRQSGYRGIHIIVDYRDRQIEIQLRTRVMHEWAIAVERLSGRLGENLKQDGVHAIQNLMKAISSAMAIEEVGGIVGDDLVAEIGTLRQIAQPFLYPNQTGGA